MAEKLGTLEIDIKIDWQKVNRSLSRVSKSVSKVSNSMGKSIRKALGGLASVASTVTGKVLSIFSRAFSKIAQIVKRSMLIAGAALTTYLVISTKMAIDVEEMQSLFSVSFKEMEGSVRSWSDEYSKRIKTNKFDTENMITTFFNMTKSVGLARDEAIDISKKFVALSNDMKSVFNLKGDIAFNKLTAAISGESEPLKRLGIIVNETAVKNELLASGVRKVKGAFTEAQKITARYNIVVKAMGDRMGDMERTLTSTANRIRILKDEFKQQAIINGTLIKNSKVFAIVLGLVEKQARKLQVLFAGKLQKTLDALDAYFSKPETIKKWNKAFSNIKVVASAIYAQLVKLLIKVVEFTQSEEFLVTLHKAWAKLKELWKALPGILTTVKNVVMDIVQGFKEWFDIGTEKELKGAGNAAFRLIDILWALNNVVSAVWKGLTVLNGWIFAVTDTISDWISVLTGSTEATNTLVKDIIRAVTVVIELSGVVWLLRNAFTVFITVVTKTGKGILWLTKLLRFVPAIMMKVWETVQLLAQGIKMIGELISFVFMGIVTALGLVTTASAGVVTALAAITAVVSFLAVKWQLFLVQGLLKSLGIFDDVNHVIDTTITGIMRLIGLIPGMRKLTNLLGITSDTSKTDARMADIEAGRGSEKNPTTPKLLSGGPKITEEQFANFDNFDPTDMFKDLIPPVAIPKVVAPEKGPGKGVFEDIFATMKRGPLKTIAPDQMEGTMDAIKKNPSLKGMLSGVNMQAAVADYFRANPNIGMPQSNTVDSGVSEGNKLIADKIDKLMLVMAGLPQKEKLVSNNYSS